MKVYRNHESFHLKSFRKVNGVVEIQLFGFLILIGL